MPSKYDEQTKAKPVRLVTEHVDDYDSEWAAITAVAGRRWMTTDTQRRWVRQAERDYVSRLTRVSRCRGVPRRKR